MNKLFVSKSDFKVAMTCPSKLYYRKLKYPTTKEGNEFLELLAEGGYMVGKLATLLYPGGFDLSDLGDPEKATEKTRDLLLNNENITIFEAGVLFQNLLIRIDILEKKGNVINLIEVKAASFDSDDRKKSIRKLGEYIEDVVFQYYVLSNAYPEFKVNPYLFMPDKAKTTNMDGLNGQFTIKKKESKPGSKFNTPDVTFNGKIADLLKDDILTLVDLTDEVKRLLPTVANHANQFSSSLNPKLNKINTPISINCKKCEFHSNDPSTDGFKQCWGKFGQAKPTILELYQLGNVNRHHDGIINSLISEGKVNLSDFPADILKPENRDDNKPYHNNRPLMQLTMLREWISDELKAELRMLKKKIHFIDFETSRMALPYHIGMRPYENVAFQWSCHTLDTTTGLITHKEWINTDEDFPNFAFAESLMAATNDGGEILIWSMHENSVLRDIYSQMDKYGYTNDLLKEWIELVVKFDKKDTTEFTNQCRLADVGYFHPSTNGRSSIKAVLPAILSCFNDKNIQKFLENFEPGLNLYKKENNEVVSPYYLLPAVKEIDNYDVREGTGAMRAYQDMLYGEIKNDPLKKEGVKQALLKYCKLDTLAMVLIYKHWMSL